MNNSLKEKIKAINTNIISWVKKHKVISLIVILFVIKLLICSSIQAYNSFKYGDYELIAEYPINKELKHNIQDIEALKINENNIIFFVKINSGYEIANLNLKTKKFEKYNTKININDIKFRKNFIKPIGVFDNKIYIISEKNNEQIIAYFDYVKDEIKNIKIFNSILYNPLKISLNNKDYILFETEPKANNEIGLILYDPIGNNTLNLSDLTMEYSKYIYQLENKNILIFYPKSNNKIISADIVNLKNKKKITESLGIKDLFARFIYLEENKFIAIHRDEFKTYITTYEIKNNKIIKISTKELKHRNTFFKSYIAIDPDNYVVLNPKTIVFVGGNSIISGFTTIRLIKDTHVYNYSNNNLKKITSFPYKIMNAKFIKINNSSFLIYGFNEKIYKLQLIRSKT